MPRTSFPARSGAAVLLTIAALGVGALPAAAADPTPGASPAASDGLTRLDWRLAQVAGSGVPFIEVPAGIGATLRIEDDRAGGSGGCNQWSADALVDGPQLAFGEILSTTMACDGPSMQFEAAYLGYLDDIRAWHLTADGRLELADGSGSVLLVFEPSVPAGSGGPVALVGTPWRATSLVQQGVAIDVPAGIDVTLAIDAAGQASGTAACNAYGGPATIDGDALSFGGLAVTEMACPEPRMALERTWLDILAATAGWRLDGDRLELLDASGGTLATLAPDAAA